MAGPKVGPRAWLVERTPARRPGSAWQRSHRGGQRRRAIPRSAQKCGIPGPGVSLACCRWPSSSPPGPVV